MELATYNDTAVAAFGQAAAALSGDAKALLKLDKGDWYTGQPPVEVPNGTELAIDMMQAEWGWVRWKDNKPAERRMTLVASGAQVPARDALGHLDEGLWDRDETGKPRDPWQKTIELHAREVSGEKREFLIAGSSRGFEGCCKQLFKTFGEGMRANAGKVPVVALGGDKYQHQKYGMVKVPALPLVAWRSLAELESKPAAKSKF
jgi:hypothetical protein